MLLKLNDNQSPMNSDYLFAKRVVILWQSGIQGRHSLADCSEELFEKEKSVIGIVGYNFLHLAAIDFKSMQRSVTSGCQKVGVLTNQTRTAEHFSTIAGLVNYLTAIPERRLN
jgi:hypothetical protein